MLECVSLSSSVEFTTQLEEFHRKNEENWHSGQSNPKLSHLTANIRFRDDEIWARENKLEHPRSEKIIVPSRRPRTSGKLLREIHQKIVGSGMATVSLR
jgi:hypothetical protein